MPREPASPRSSIGAAFPLEVAGAALVEREGRILIRTARRTSEDSSSPKRVHKLRVACRQLEVALAIAEQCCSERQRGSLLKLVNHLRQTAGRVRAWDVLLDQARTGFKAGAIESRREFKAIARVASISRARSSKRLSVSLESYRLSKLDRAIDRLVDGMSPPACGPRLLSDAAIERIRSQSDAVKSLVEQPGHDIETVHELRIAMRQLRYMLRIAGSCLPAHLLQRVLDGLADEQRAFGVVADTSSTLSLIERHHARFARLPNGLSDRLAEWLGRASDAGRRNIQERLEIGGFSRLLAELQAWTNEARTAEWEPDADPIANAVALAPTREDRFAVIDVGSNSVRLLVAQSRADVAYEILDDEKESTRLGQGLVATGLLSAQSMLRTAEAIARMRGIAQGFGVARLRAIGTSAVRDATNQREFLNLVRDRAGIALDVLSEEDEARNAHRSVAAGFDIGETPTAVVDIGGGSTEVVLSTKGAIEQLSSVPIGAVRLAEMFPPGDGDGAVKRMRRYVQKAMSQSLPTPPFAPVLVVGTGGTFTAIAALLAAKSPPRDEAGISPEIRRSEVRHLVDRLGSMTLRERMRTPRLNPERADIIVAGTVIADGVLRFLNVNRLRVYDKGIRDGIMLSMIAERGAVPTAPSSSRSMAAVRRFAEACRYERAHSEHVAKLAMRLFDQLVRDEILPHRLATAECRMLLEAAAVLHDVGHLVNYAKHHKHSMRLISNSDIRGFTPRQLSIIAQIARYHRRAEPSLRHGRFKRLSRDDRGIVAKLAAILRVADGLDRAHTQAVHDATLRLGTDHEGVRELIVGASSHERPTTDLWGAEQKAGLLESEFGVRVRCQWDPPITTCAEQTGLDREPKSASTNHRGPDSFDFDGAAPDRSTLPVRS